MAALTVMLICSWSMFSAVVLINGQQPNCKAEEYEVQKDFDPVKFSGRWFGLSYLPNPNYPENLPFQDFSLTFLPLDDGNYSAYRTARSIAADSDCVTQEGVLRMPNANTNISARMEWQSEINNPATVTPLWVLETDYTSYAVVYWCAGPVNVTTGFCEEADVNSWAVVRDIYSPLSQRQMENVTLRRSQICTNTSLYQPIVHGPEQCKLLSPMFWTPQPGFNLARYMGRWYEQLYVPSAPIPPQDVYTNYQHNYALRQDGTISLRISGRDPANPTVCFNNTGRTVEETETPGKWIYKVSDEKMYDYVVVSTDYDGYAFVLGCVTVSPDGNRCLKFRSWVWTRSRYMTGSQALLTKRLMDLYGLADKDFLTDLHSNTCTWEPKPPVPKECKDTNGGTVKGVERILIFTLSLVIVVTWKLV